MTASTTINAPTGFQGRSAELRALRRALAAAEQGAGRCILVSGAAGIGKTRLVEEALSALPRDRVIWGRCHDVEGSPAYWPWTQALRALMRPASPDELRAQVGEAATDLLRLMPELRERLEEIPESPRLELEQARFRLLDAVAMVLNRASRPGLLVVVLDDLHWADGESLLLLSFVAGEISRSRLLLVGTYREEEMRLSSAAPRVLADLARASERVLLGGLDPSEVTRMVEGLIDERPPADLATEIHRATEGNPFFVTEVAGLIRDERQRGAVHERLALGFRLPDTVREAILRRIDPLPRDTRQLLTMAAVIGSEVRLVPLSVAAGVTSDAALGHLEPARLAGLLIGALEHPGRLRFSHALVRQALLDELSVSEKALLHRQAGEAMERAFADDLSPFFGELAHFFLATADPAYLKKAVDYACKAGERALAALGFEEAAGHFARALAAERADAGRPGILLHLLLRFGEAQRRSGDEENARATLAEAARLARELDAPEALALAATQYAGARAETGEVDVAAVALLEDSLATLDPSSLMQPYVRGLLSTALYFGTQAERCERLSREAVAASRASGDAQALAMALVNRHFVLWRPGTAEERLALANEAIGLADRVQYVEAICEARAWRILDLLELGRIQEANDELARHAEEAERLVLPRYRWHVLLVRAAMALLVGDLDGAERFSAQAMAVRQSKVGNNAAQFFAVQTFYLHREQGRLGALAEMLAAAVEQHATLPIWRCGLALAEIARGRSEAATTLLDALSVDDFAALPFDGNWLPAMTSLAEVCAALGDARRAAAIHRLLAPYADLWVVVGTSAAIAGPVVRFLGLLALTEGRAVEAARYFEQAASVAERAGARPEAARAAEGLARAHAQMGGTGAAAPAPAAAARAPLLGRLAREGDFWTLRCGSETVRLKDTKGLAYLQVLLRHPGAEIHALELAGGSPDERSPRAGDAGEMLDDDAQRAYRRRIAAIETALARDGKADAEALAAERQSLERELARAIGLGGRVRRTGSDAERARLNVTRAIAAVVRKVQAECPVVGRHLEIAVRTGTFCSYEPDPTFPVQWDA